MIIAILGANGYIAQNLINELERVHHSVVPIERSILYDIVRLSEILSESDVVINLAGAPIMQRWTKANRNEIFRSRIETTHNIVKAINGLPENEKPHTFISASAIGIYLPDKTHSDESTSFSNDFIAEVVKSWENASVELSSEVRKVIFRIGLILGKEAKTIQKLLPVFEMGFGGKIGTGKQPFPFIHIIDVVRAILWSIENEKTHGTYNLVAPENIDNKTFTKVFSNSLNKPAFFTVPEFSLKLMYGEASSLLLQSAQVVPERLLKEGFVFSFPDIKACITAILA